MAVFAPHHCNTNIHLKAHKQHQKSIAAFCSDNKQRRHFCSPIHFFQRHSDTAPDILTILPWNWHMGADWAKRPSSLHEKQTTWIAKIGGWKNSMQLQILIKYTVIYIRFGLQKPCHCFFITAFSFLSIIKPIWWNVKCFYDIVCHSYFLFPTFFCSKINCFLVFLSLKIYIWVFHAFSLFAVFISCRHSLLFSKIHSFFVKKPSQHIIKWLIAYPHKIAYSTASGCILGCALCEILSHSLYW